MRSSVSIGGMSWESSAVYYRLVNEGARAPGRAAQRTEPALHGRLRGGGGDAARGPLGRGRRRARGRGAPAGVVWGRLVVLCTNTMHKVADADRGGGPIPLLHIADATAAALVAGGFHRVGLWHAFTMEQDFYRGRLRERSARRPGARRGGPARRPPGDLRGAVPGHRADGSKAAYTAVMPDLVGRAPRRSCWAARRSCCWSARPTRRLPLFDTTALHAAAAVDFALA